MVIFSFFLNRKKENMTIKFVSNPSSRSGVAPLAGMSSTESRPPTERSSSSQRSGRLQAPYRDGWVEVREELQRVSLMESGASEFHVRWAVLRESFLYFFENEADIAYSGHVLKVDLRGAICQVPSFPRPCRENGD